VYYEDAPDGGSRFVVELPLMEPPPRLPGPMRPEPS
jgi:hypothetical protein